jgi:HemY protein
VIRILIYLLSLVLFTWAVTALLSLDGWIEGRVLGVRYDVQTGFAAVFLLILVVLAVALTSFVKDLRRAPKVIGAKRAESKQATALAAIASGFEAIAAGDVDAAQKHARTALRSAENPAHARLLLAQAAQLAGDDEAARAQFEAMAASADTEATALRGLYLQARNSSALADALAHARRAFELNPSARWAYEAVFAIALELGNWRDARQYVRQGAKLKHIGHAAARRAEAALLGAEAYADEAKGDHAGAAAAAEDSIKLQPDFAPSALLAAKYHAAQGRTPRAAKTLEHAFAVDPQPSLAAAYVGLLADEPPAKVAEAVSRLIARNPSSSEAAFLDAKRSLILAEGKAAIDALKPILIDLPAARHFLLMADAAAITSGPDAARTWLQRAAAAGRETPGENGFEGLTSDGWRLLIRQYAEFGRLFPPAIERPRSAVTEADLKLIAPPPPEAPADTIAAGDAAAVIGAARQVS